VIAAVLIIVFFVVLEALLIIAYSVGSKGHRSAELRPAQTVNNIAKVDDTAILNRFYRLTLYSQPSFSTFFVALQPKIVCIATTGR